MSPTSPFTAMAMLPGRSQPADSARARLAHDVRLALRRSGHSELRGVEVNVVGDQLAITGRVPTYYLKQLSQELARNAAPEHQICNHLVVRIPNP